MVNKIYIYLGIVLVIHLLFVIPCMNQPYHGDEAIIIKAGEGVIDSGSPITDYGLNMPNFKLDAHIPLQSYLLGLFYLFFGGSFYSMRMLSVVCNVFSIILVYLIAKEMLKENPKKEFWALAASILYGLNPLVIQNSIAVTVDGGLLNLALCIFVYLFIKENSWIYLVPSLVFVFLSKEVGFPILFLAVFIFYGLNFEIKKMLKFFLIFFSSLILTLLIWSGFSRIFNLSFSAPLLHNFQFGASGYSLLKLMTSLWEFKNFVYFLIPALAILFLILTLYFYYKLITDKQWKKDKKLMFFNILAILVPLLYLYWGRSAWGFPSYQSPAIPAICIFIICMLSKIEIKQDLEEIKKHKKTLLILAVLAIIYFLLVIPRPLMPEFDAIPSNTNVVNAAILVAQSFSLYFIVPFCALVLVGIILKLKWRICFALICLTLIIMLYLNVSHILADYSTYSKYGDSGVQGVLDYVNKNHIDTKSIATHAHFGIYWGMDKYYEITFVYEDPVKFENEIVNNTNINYLIIWQRDIARIGEDMKYFYLEKKAGSYYIFKKIDKNSPVTTLNPYY